MPQVGGQAGGQGLPAACSAWRPDSTVLLQVCSMSMVGLGTPLPTLQLARHSQDKNKSFKEQKEKVKG